MKASFVFVPALVFGFGLAAIPFGRAESFTFFTPAGAVGQPPTLGQSGDGTNSAARFKSPSGFALDSNTNLFLTDATTVRRVTRSGTNWVVTTLAGNTAIHGTLDGTNGMANFDDPQGLTVDSVGVLYVADTFNNAIRKVTS